MPAAIPFSTPENLRTQPIHPSERLAFVGIMEALNCCPSHELDHFALRLIVDGTREAALTVWLHELSRW